MGESDRRKYPCMTTGCRELTGHISGFCEPCRTRKCRICGKAFVILNHRQMGRGRCADCEAAMVRRDNRERVYIDRPPRWNQRRK